MKQLSIRQWLLISWLICLILPGGIFNAVEALQHRVRSEIMSALAVNVGVKLVEPKSIQRSEGKAKRVVDLRQS